jgi:hypothetical protein
MGVVHQVAGRDVKSLIAPMGSFPVNVRGSTSDEAGRRLDASIMTSLRVEPDGKGRRGLARTMVGAKEKKGQC